MSECETCNNAYVGISLVDGVCRECRLEDENGELKSEVKALREFLIVIRDQKTPWSMEDLEALLEMSMVPCGGRFDMDKRGK